jgi:Winged helix-turn helix
MKSYFEDRDGDWVIRFDEQGRTVSSTFLFRMCHPSSTLRTKPSLLGSSRRVRSRRSTAWCAGRARDLIMRLHEEFGLSVSDDTIYGALKELGFSHVSARPKAYKQDAEAMEGVQKQLRRACGGSPRETCLGHTGRGMDPGRDRVGQTNKLTYRLARKGSRPRASHESTHPVDLSVRRGMPAKHGAGVALALPAASSRRDRHQGHPPAATPFSFSIKPADMAQKDLRVPSSISLLPLSPRHAPSSTARKTSGSSCVRTGCRTASSNLFNDIVDHCCYAWNTLIDQSWKIMSIAHRDSAVVGHSL